MAPSYKLTYFAADALGEPIRWLLSIGKQEFEDHRFDRDDWPKIKPTTPFGQVPLLEIDNKTYFQHTAISRYLAREYGLVGKTNLDALQADIIVDSITDLRTSAISYFYDQNPVTKAPKLEPLQKETVPFFLSRFEKIVVDNNGYFVNGQLTWADIYFIAISKYLQKITGNLDFFKDYPNLAALKKKVESIPEIQAWIAKRPASLLP